MKNRLSIATALSLVLLTAVPLSATGAYAVSELDTHHPSPLEIMSDRLKRTTAAQNRQQPHPKRAKKTAVKKHYTASRNRSKILYLTFDDGPVTGTANVLRVLREEGIDATMFFVGKHIRKSRALYNRALSMPNLLIANHTYSHANGKYSQFYSNIIRVINDVDRAQKMIGGAKYLRLAGRNVWRLPHIYRNDHAISSNRRAIEVPKYNALASRGYQIYGWDIEWQFDHNSGRPAYDAAVMAARIEQRYRRHAMAKQGKMILLTHDYMFRGASGTAQLRALIRTLKYNGWRFATIDDYSSRTPAVLVKRKKQSKPAKSTDPLKALRAASRKPKQTIEIAWTRKSTYSDTRKILQVQ